MILTVFYSLAHLPFPQVALVACQAAIVNKNLFLMTCLVK